MTNEEAQIIIGNIPIKPEALDDCYDITEYQEAKTMAIQALAQTEWIPVSERLPDENGSYLVTVKRGYIVLGLWIGVAENWANVIAWLPLPPCYKPKESEE